MRSPIRRCASRGARSIASADHARRGQRRSPQARCRRNTLERPQRRRAAGEGQCRAHRNKRNRVNSEPAGPKIPNDRNRQSQNHRRGRERPTEIGKVPSIGHAGCNPRRQSGNGDGNERRPAGRARMTSTYSVLMPFWRSSHRKCLPLCSQIGRATQLQLR